jgi:hypothetical protein
VVKDTRKTSGPGDIRSLNEPTALLTKVNENGLPVSFRLRGRWFSVGSVSDRWRIEDEWWREQPVSRNYFTCVADGGITITVFQDLISEQWYSQKT